jgi:hypothetical protein
VGASLAEVGRGERSGSHVRSFRRYHTARREGKVRATGWGGQLPRTRLIPCLLNTHLPCGRQLQQQESNFVKFPQIFSISSSVARLTACPRNVLPPSSQWSCANPLR